MRGKDNIKPDGMDWVTKSRPAPPSPGVITCRGDRALMTAYQTDSESGKEVNEAGTEEVLVSSSFFSVFVGMSGSKAERQRKTVNLYLLFAMVV